MKVRKKEIFEAIQFNGDNLEELKEFAEPYISTYYKEESSFEWPMIQTLSEGSHKISINDYVLKDQYGFIFWIDPLAFEKYYEVIME